MRVAPEAESGTHGLKPTRFHPFDVHVRPRHLFWSLVISVTLATATSAAADPPEPTRPTLTSGTVKRSAAGFSVAGAEGAVYRFPGGPVLSAEAGAELRLLPNSQPLSLSGGGTTPGYTVILRAGTLAFELPKGSKSALVLAAPRRTTAIIQSGSVGASATATHTAIVNGRGSTTVSTGDGAYQPLPEGRVQVVDTKVSVRDAVATPSQLLGRRLVVAPSGSRAIGKLSWSPVEGATEYRVRLHRSGEAKPQLDVRVPETSVVLDSPLTPGSYRFSVVAVDSSGFASAIPLERPVQVVGVTLPEGAYTDDNGTVFLSQAQEVGFTGVDGLEMTYGRAGRFVKAAPKAGLFRGEATVVHFRFPGTSEVASARLAPRALRAVVEMTPRSASWPKDSIEVRYRVVDGSGKPAPDWVEPRARVLLGVEPVDVAFREEGGWRKAKVPPRHGSGPWVLRVEVEDQHGVQLGRDFVEIVRSAQKPTSRTVVRRKPSERLAQR